MDIKDMLVAVNDQGLLKFIEEISISAKKVINIEDMLEAMEDRESARLIEEALNDAESR